MCHAVENQNYGPCNLYAFDIYGQLDIEITFHNKKFPVYFGTVNFPPLFLLAIKIYLTLIHSRFCYHYELCFVKLFSSFLINVFSNICEQKQYNYYCILVKLFVLCAKYQSLFVWCLSGNLYAQSRCVRWLTLP